MIKGAKRLKAEIDILHGFFEHGRVIPMPLRQIPRRHTGFDDGNIRIITHFERLASFLISKPISIKTARIKPQMYLVWPFVRPLVVQS